MHRIEAYITFALLLLTAITLLALPIFFLLRKRKGISILRQFACLFWGVSLGLILFATIFFVWPITFRPEYRFLNLVPFDWLRLANPVHMFMIEVVPNILFFIPLGLFTPIVFSKMRSWAKTFLFVFLVTFGVETIQFCIGRTADIDDILANFLGGVIGFLLFAFLHRLCKNSKIWRRLIGTKPVDESSTI